MTERGMGISSKKAQCLFDARVYSLESTASSSVLGISMYLFLGPLLSELCLLLAPSAEQHDSLRTSTPRKDQITCVHDSFTRRSVYNSVGGVVGGWTSNKKFH